jgi:hypothetical protein
MIAIIRIASWKDYAVHPQFPGGMNMNRFFATFVAAAVTVSAVSASAQTIAPAGHAMPTQGASMPEHQMHHMAFDMEAGKAPTMPGQEAFGTVQEIVRFLDADPTTDWSKVNLEVLRQHLIDMDDVTMRADAAAQPIDGGLRIAVTGEGRTVDAIRRMVPAHAHEIDGQNGWSARTEPLDRGMVLTVTSADPKQVARIRGLGFIGIMVQGSHHQMHHLAMARGEFSH